MDHVEEDSPRIQRSRIAVEVVAVTFVGEARDVCGGAELRGGDAQVREFVQPQARRLQVDAEHGCTGQIPARDGDDRRHGDRGLDEQGARRDRERVDGAVRSRGRQGSAPGRNRLGRGPGLSTVMTTPDPAMVVVVVLLVVVVVGPAMVVVVVVLVVAVVASHATSANRCVHLSRRCRSRWQRPGFDGVTMHWRAKRLQVRRHNPRVPACDSEAERASARITSIAAATSPRAPRPNAVCLSLVMEIAPPEEGGVKRISTV